eukprot:7105982-Alexandrium_andersonii.AAC.1
MAIPASSSATEGAGASSAPAAGNMLDMGPTTPVSEATAGASAGRRGKRVGCPTKGTGGGPSWVSVDPESG